MCPSCQTITTTGGTDAVNFTAKLFSHDECQAKIESLQSQLAECVAAIASQTYLN